MRVYRLEDVSETDISSTDYDLAIFACGYEKRARHLPRRLDRRRVRKAAVLSFSDFRDEGDRGLNEEYFSKDWTSERVELSSWDDKSIYEALDSAVGAKACDGGRILVDYSSMPRLWYASIMNWARFGAHRGEIIIDFVYSVGEHRELLRPMVINEILCIPGCEGGPISSSKAVAVFGLGFDGLPPLCVLDRMEPDIVYSYLASPAAFPDYPDRARRANQTLIDDYAQINLELPLESVETTFRLLGELVEPHRKEADISIIPMGPKPHVLASILLAMRFEEVSCLRVTGRRDSGENVDTNGVLVCTSVQFRPI